MMRIAAFLLALVAAPAVAQDAIPLKWSLKEGDKFYAKDETTMDMSMGAMGLNQEVKLTATIVQRFKVTSAKQDSTTVEMTIMSLDMKSETPIPGLGAVGERVKGAAISAILDENLAVKKLVGYDKFLDKISGDDDKTRKEMKEQFSELAVTQMFTDVFSFGPGKPVKVGDTWPKTEKMSIGGVDAEGKMKYKLDSVTSGIAKLGYTGDLTFKAGARLPGLPEGLQVDKLDMKADKFAGTLTFDTKAGRLTEGTQGATLEGSMTISAAGQKIEMTMTIKVKSKVTIDEKNPVKD